MCVGRYWGRFWGESGWWWKKAVLHSHLGPRFLPPCESALSHTLTVFSICLVLQQWYISVLSIFHVYNLVYGDTKFPEKTGKGACLCTRRQRSQVWWTTWMTRLYHSLPLGSPIICSFLLLHKQTRYSLLPQVKQSQAPSSHCIKQKSRIYPWKICYSIWPWDLDVLL